MTPLEMKAKGKADGRQFIEAAQEQGKDMSTYLAMQIAICDLARELEHWHFQHAAGMAAYADGVLSCFD